MTNEELKKKICDIIAPYVSAYGDDERIADALIAANIFVDIDTLKEEQQSMNGILTNMSSYMNYKLHELEHRAARAERALYIACFNYAKLRYVNGINDMLAVEYANNYKEQAEKELEEEEGKDD